MISEQVNAVVKAKVIELHRELAITILSKCISNKALHPVDLEYLCEYREFENSLIMNKEIEK